MGNAHAPCSSKTGFSIPQLGLRLDLSVGIGPFRLCFERNRRTATSIDRDQGSSENIGSLSDVISANANDPEAYNVRGSAYGRAGNYKAAMNDFDRAIEINPGFYQAYANRALIHRRLGALGNAASDYNRALQLNPQYDAAYIGRGNLYRNAGRTNEAFADFERAIQLDTTDPRAYHNRGLIYQSRGQHDFAIEDFSTAISLSPTPRSPTMAAASPILPAMTM